MHVSSDECKFGCCKEQYCIGNQNITSMNQGKLDMVKQEMARMNIMKKQKYMTPEDEPRLIGVQYTTGEEPGAIARSSRKNEAAGSMQK